MANPKIPNRTAAHSAPLSLTGQKRENTAADDGVQVWQTLFIAGVIGMTLVRDWPWTHTVYFVLHGLVMLMKQHSYAFYNGHLSSVYKERGRLLAALDRLGDPAPSDVSPSEAEAAARPPPPSQDRKHEIEKIDAALGSSGSGSPLDEAQLRLFGRLLRREADALGVELRGVAAADEPGRWYPRNVTARNFYEYIALPTLVVSSLGVTVYLTPFYRCLRSTFLCR